MTERLRLIALLMVLGAGWGLTMPLSKIAVSTGYLPFGIIFWQSLIIATMFIVISCLRRKGLPLRWVHMRLYLAVGLMGTILPNGLSNTAAVHLPAGLLAILLSTVPMMAFPVALLLGLDRFQMLRAGGLLLGLIGVLILIVPDASLPEGAAAIYIPVALGAALCYGTEGNLVALWRCEDLDPVQIMLGGSIVALTLSAGLALTLDQWINPVTYWGAAEYALVASSLTHGVVYGIFVWLVGRAGPVFAVQVAYPVTAFGVIWSMILLNESYGATIWIGFALICGGIFLVQPRPAIDLAEGAPIGDDRA